MIQVNRIYLIFNRLVTKKFLVDTSDAISTLTIAIQFLFYLIHSPRLAMMDVGGWMFYITAACSHAALWALIPYIISLIVAITVRRHQAAAITHIILVSLLNILAYIDTVCTVFTSSISMVLY